MKALLVALGDGKKQGCCKEPVGRFWQVKTPRSRTADDEPAWRDRRKS